MFGACGREKTRRGDSAPSLGACRKKTREAVVKKTREAMVILLRKVWMVNRLRI